MGIAFLYAVSLWTKLLVWTPTYTSLWHKRVFSCFPRKTGYISKKQVQREIQVCPIAQKIWCLSKYVHPLRDVCPSEREAIEANRIAPEWILLSYGRRTAARSIQVLLLQPSMKLTEGNPIHHKGCDWAHPKPPIQSAKLQNVDLQARNSSPNAPTCDARHNAKHLCTSLVTLCAMGRWQSEVCW